MAKKKSKVDKFLKKIKYKKKKFSLKDLVPIIAISILIGSIIGGVLTYRKEKVEIIHVPSDLEELVDVYESISSNYYEKLEKQKLLDAAMKAMLEELDDPYSVFLDESDSSKFNETINGEYVGIGATMTLTENGPTVVEVYDKSPAKEAGLKPEDIIIKIDKEEAKDKTLNEITKLVKGKKNTTVTLTIKRKDKEKEIKIKRSSIDIPVVESTIFEKDKKQVGYIYISTFSSNVYEQFKTHLEKLEKKKIDSLIIDVRDNPGGHLDQVTDILELFLDKKKVLYQVQTKGKNKKVYDQTKEHRTYKVAVIINKASASASEILASSLKDSYKASIVGEQSYGKGTVQKSYQLSSGSTVKYTTQKWLTAKGKWIDKKGVTPNYKIELTDKYKEEPTYENDNQLNKAIDILTEKENKKDDKKEEKNN